MVKVKGTKRRALEIKRAFRVRKKLLGSSERPRLSINKTNRHLFAQVIDDSKGITLVAFSTLSKEVKGTSFAKKGKEAARKIGEEVAERALAQNIKGVVFDRGPHKYHGLLAEIAEAARGKGLEF